MGKIKLTEKIELYIRYAMDFFDECKDKNKIYELLINREDLLRQLDKTPDSFWNEVKKQKQQKQKNDDFLDEYFSKKMELWNGNRMDVSVICSFSSSSVIG